MRRVLLLSFLVLFSALPALSPAAEQAGRVIEVHAHRFAFEPASITIHRGETVHLRLLSDDVPHSLLIRELGINEEATRSHPGEIVFTAPQAGDFAGRCGRFCGTGHGHMIFSVHVTEE
jgi:cytochrome c oxidase subunit II